MNNIPCEVAKDLMPSYVDGLTSKETNELLEEHVSGCPDCSKTLEAMRDTTKLPVVPEPEEEKEIDFLKKNRKRNRSVLFGAIFAVLALVLVLFVRFFVIGEVMYGAFNIYDIQVEGNSLFIKGELNSNAFYKIKGFRQDEKNGVVTFTAKGTRRIFADGTDERMTFDVNYNYDNEITMVRMDDRVLWHDGARISELAANLYETRHDSMGDMSANAKTASTLILPAYLGNYENALQSGEAPLTWTIHLKDPVAPVDREAKEQLMHSAGYAFLAVIGNLDAVRFEYECDGAGHAETITAEEATSFFGQDIKNCMTSARLLDEMLHKTELFAMLWFDSTRPEVGEMLRFSLQNDSDTEIAAVSFALYLGDALIESGGGMNADNSPIENGETIWFDLRSLGQSGEKYHLEFIIRTTDGKEHRVEEKIPLSDDTEALMPLTLTGNPESGFHIVQ